MRLQPTSLKRPVCAKTHITTGLPVVLSSWRPQPLLPNWTERQSCGQDAPRCHQKPEEPRNENSSCFRVQAGWNRCYLAPICYPPIIDSLTWSLFMSLLTPRLVLLCVGAHRFIFWDVPGDVLAAPESALCGWIGVIPLSDEGVGVRVWFRVSSFGNKRRTAALAPALTANVTPEANWGTSREGPDDTDAAKQARTDRLETAVKVHIRWKRTLPNGALHTKHA